MLIKYGVFSIISIFASQALFAETTTPSPAYFDSTVEVSIQEDYLAGAIVGTVLGLGIGHIVQGRYAQIGWVFTVGEPAAFISLVLGVMMIFVHNAEVEASLLSFGGLLGFCGLKAWEMADLWNAQKRMQNTTFSAHKDLARISYVEPLKSAEVHIPLLVLPF